MCKAFDRYMDNTTKLIVLPCFSGFQAIRERQNGFQIRRRWRILRFLHIFAERFPLREGKAVGT